MDALHSVLDPLREFSKDSIRLVRRCHKPDRKGMPLPLSEKPICEDPLEADDRNFTGSLNPVDIFKTSIETLYFSLASIGHQRDHLSFEKAEVGMQVEDLWDIQEQQLTPTEKLNLF